MADQTHTLALLAQALTVQVGKRLTRQQNRSDVLLNLMPKRTGSGPASACNIEVGTDTGVVFTEGQAITTFQADTPLRSSQDWKEYGDTVKLTLERDKKAREVELVLRGI